MQDESTSHDVRSLAHSHQARVLQAYSLLLRCRPTRTLLLLNSMQCSAWGDAPYVLELLAGVRDAGRLLLAAVQDMALFTFPVIRGSTQQATQAHATQLRGGCVVCAVALTALELPQAASY